MEDPQSPKARPTSLTSSPALSVSENSAHETPEIADDSKGKKNDEAESHFSVFSTSDKILVIVIASVASVVSPFTGSVYFPALNTLADDLRVSTSSINLTITSYQIFQGLAPSVIGTLSDVCSNCRDIIMYLQLKFLGSW